MSNLFRIVSARTADTQSNITDIEQQLKGLEMIFSAGLDPRWTGTTYPLNKMTRTADFISGFTKMVKDGKTVDEIVEQIGTPSDYLRLGSYYSFLLERLISLHAKAEAYCFGSTKGAIMAVITAENTHDVNIELCFEGKSSFKDSDIKYLNTLRHGAGTISVREHTELSRLKPSKDKHSIRVVIPKTPMSVEALKQCRDISCDAIAYMHNDIQNSSLVVESTEAIDPSEIKVMRKRLDCATTPWDAHAIGQSLVTAQEEINDIQAYTHRLRKQMEVETALNKFYDTKRAAVSNSGLSMEKAIFLALKPEGGRLDIIRPNDPYGGTHKLLDILKQYGISNHGFEVKKNNMVTNVVAATRDRLEAANTAEEKTATAVFLECPSNPDQVVTDLPELISELRVLKTEFGLENDIPIVVDSTMSPGSTNFPKDYPLIITQSASKFLSAGKAVGGMAVSHDESLIHRIQAQVNTFSNQPSIALLDAMTEMMPSLADRARKASNAAYEFKDWYTKWTKGSDTMINAIDTATGIQSSIVAFHLPVALKGREAEFIERLVSQYPSSFVNCVSYGQQKKTYIIQPDKSTQGSLPDEFTDPHKIRIAFGSDINVDNTRQNIETILLNMMAEKNSFKIPDVEISPDIAQTLVDALPKGYGPEDIIHAHVIASPDLREAAAYNAANKQIKPVLGNTMARSIESPLNSPPEAGTLRFTELTLVGKGPSPEQSRMLSEKEIEIAGKTAQIQVWDHGAAYSVSLIGGPGAPAPQFAAFSTVKLLFKKTPDGQMGKFVDGHISGSIAFNPGKDADGQDTLEEQAVRIKASMMAMIEAIQAELNNEDTLDISPDKIIFCASTGTNETCTAEQAKSLFSTAPAQSRNTRLSWEPSEIQVIEVTAHPHPIHLQVTAKITKPPTH